MERGDSVTHHVPYDLVVDPKVIMNEPVSHSGHGSPFDVGVLRTEVDGEFLRCFPNDLKTPDERALKGLV